MIRIKFEIQLTGIACNKTDVANNNNVTQIFNFSEEFKCNK